jgi:hypothetical protein
MILWTAALLLAEKSYVVAQLVALVQRLLAASGRAHAALLSARLDAAIAQTRDLQARAVAAELQVQALRLATGGERPAYNPPMVRHLRAV